MRDLGLALVKSSIEAGNLRQVRQALPDNPDWYEIMRLMQRSQGSQLIERGDDLVRRQYGTGVGLSAMDHAMSYPY
jgi:hypothetical protein